MMAPMRPVTIQVQPNRDAPDWNESDDLDQVTPISLETFYDSVADITMSDEDALKYMTFAANISYVSFKNQAEMMSFKGDFAAALSFIQKLDELDVSEMR